MQFGFVAGLLSGMRAVPPRGGGLVLDSALGGGDLVLTRENALVRGTTRYREVVLMTSCHCDERY
jgi:hypothetical protein